MGSRSAELSVKGGSETGAFSSSGHGWFFHQRGISEQLLVLVSSRFGIDDGLAILSAAATAATLGIRLAAVERASALFRPCVFGLLCAPGHRVAVSSLHSHLGQLPHLRMLAGLCSLGSPPGQHGDDGA